MSSSYVTATTYLILPCNQWWHQAGHRQPRPRPRTRPNPFVNFSKHYSYSARRLPGTWPNPGTANTCNISLSILVHTLAVTVSLFKILCSWQLLGIATFVTLLQSNNQHFITFATKKFSRVSTLFPGVVELTMQPLKLISII